MIDERPWRLETGLKAAKSAPMDCGPDWSRADMLYYPRDDKIVAAWDGRLLDSSQF